MSDDHRPTMNVLAGASRVKIGRANFSTVGRDQYNDCTVHQTIIQTQYKKRKIGRYLPELSEFTEIKRGDIYKSKDVCYSWRLRSNGKDDTEAAVFHAEINIIGSFGQKKFTVKTYRGQNAIKEWRRDFLRCSQDWRGDIPLFGYNQSSVPSLIFCGELVPVAHVEGGLRHVGLYYIELLRFSLGCSRNELWMDPSQGKFCRGPIGPQCHEWRDDDFDITVPSDLDFLKEDVVIRYFSSIQDDRRFLGALTNSCHAERPENIPAADYTQVISGLTNSIIALSQNARWWSWKDCLGNREVMPDGATRFCLRDDRSKIEVDSVNERYPWLSQALSVFHAHNIPLDEDLSSYKLVYSYFRLTGAFQKSKNKRQRRCLCPTIYLFFRPSPYPLYHWSFDPTGQTPFSPDMCKYLGLPFKLTLQVTHCQKSWPTKIYKAVHAHQIARGFDPNTTDFARYLGWPRIFEIVPVDNRIQGIVNSEQQEIPAQSEGLPLPAVNGMQDGSERVPELNVSCDGQVQVQDPDEPDEPDGSFTLDLLFYEIQDQGYQDVHDPRSGVNTASTRTAVGTTRKRSQLYGFFTPFIRGVRSLSCSNPDCSVT
ncbi:hypothetical protein E1B28_011735 [Marasmius oreades]|uniref:Uncharacterized protein n=1 Tax=Marasmius oreades TaxID=181124 RepID=A0A9P7RVT4_9AGAR|nr:uncharacterized protein E1B28_011735 [Marasmius oreades]KAG7090126.1 hypothetical protein E1B28_011735 [Marasmius oreades]